MKILKIDKNKNALYSKDGVNFDAVVNIGKEDILEILQLIINNDDIFDMDECTDSNPISNKAEEIIYKNLYLKIKNFILEKENIINDNSNLFAEALEKYDVN